MSDIAKEWASILHFARTGKEYNKTTPNMEAAIYAGDRIAKLEAENAKLREALEVLAKLGNGDHYGNSDGNCIAIAALEADDE